MASLGQTATAESSDPVHHSNRPARSVSVAKLSAAPNKYVGERVRLSGYLLCPSKQSKTRAILCAKRNTKKRSSTGQVDLVLDDAYLKLVPAEKSREVSYFDKKYVVVEGVFDNHLQKDSHSGCVHVYKIESQRVASEPAKISPSGYGANFKPNPGAVTEVGDFPNRSRTSHLYAR
jgi:hypothetical protein